MTLGRQQGFLCSVPTVLSLQRVFWQSGHSTCVTSAGGVCRKEECSTERACPAGVRERGRCSSVLYWCFIWAVYPVTLYSQPIRMAVSCFVTFFPSGGMFLLILKAQIRKRLCLSSAPSDSAGVFVISCCRDWGLCWKEHWLPPFTASVALISAWHGVVLGIISRGGKPVFPPSPGADTETLGETVKAFSRPARALPFGGWAGAVQAWACPEAALGFVFLILSLWCGSMCRVLCQPPCSNSWSINLFLLGWNIYSAEELAVVKVVRHWWSIFCHIFQIFQCCLRGLSSYWVLQVLRACFFTRREIKSLITWWLSCLRGQK